MVTRRALDPEIPGSRPGPAAMKFRTKDLGNYARNFIFGAEDSLISTVGVLSGINIGGVSKQNLILAGIVLIFVEAFSMGIGVLLSEHSEKEIISKKEIKLFSSLKPALVMFFSYFFAGFIPLFPYFFINKESGLYFSIFASLIGLFLLGIIAARLSKTNLLKHGAQMMLIGGSAVIIGAAVAKIIK